MTQLCRCFTHLTDVSAPVLSYTSVGSIFCWQLNMAEIAQAWFTDHCVYVLEMVGPTSADDVCRRSECHACQRRVQHDGRLTRMFIQLGHRIPPIGGHTSTHHSFLLSFLSVVPRNNMAFCSTIPSEFTHTLCNFSISLYHMCNERKRARQHTLFLWSVIFY